MNKPELIKKYFNQKEKLTLKNKVYFNQVKTYLTNSLADDLGDKGDITSNALIKDNPKAKAVIIAKQSGILAGIEEIVWFAKNYPDFLSQENRGSSIPPQRNRDKIHGIKYKTDGQQIKRGDKILTITGGVKDILKIERTILNLLQRMSGIATETNKLIRKTKNKTLICSTRKTPLGLLDKKAVTVGGGGTHRLGLYDWILVKDNHLKISNFKFQISKRFWEIEVDTEKQALKFAKFNPGAIMFDNLSPRQIKNIIKILNPSAKLRANKYKPNIIFEASGGINEKNIAEYSKTGVDVISIGYLTHSAKALDLSLEIKK